MINEKTILEKIKQLPEKYKDEVIDFIDFLISKSKENTLKESIEDINNNNINIIENNDDLEKHFNRLEI